MKKNILILVSFLFMSNVFAQTIPLYFHFSGHSALPKSQFKSNGFENGGGIQMLLMSGAINNGGSTLPWNKGYKLQLGFGLEGNIFGNKAYQVELSTPSGAMGEQQISNRSSAWYGLARLSHTNRTAFIFFGEFLAGQRNIISQEKISITSGGTADPLITDTFKANVFTMGLGFGVAVKFSDNFFLEAKTTYFIGGTGKYLPIIKTSQPINQVYYNSQNGNTNLLLTQVGIIWRLGPMIKKCGCALSICGALSGGSSNGSGNTTHTRTTTQTPPKTDPMQRGTRKTTTPQTPGNSTPATPSTTPPTKKPIEVKPDPKKNVPR